MKRVSEEKSKGKVHKTWDARLRTEGAGSRVRRQKAQSAWGVAHPTATGHYRLSRAKVNKNQPKIKKAEEGCTRIAGRDSSLALRMTSLNRFLRSLCSVEMTVGGCAWSK